MADSNAITLAQYGLAGVCIYIGGAVTSAYTRTKINSIRSFIVYLTFLTVLISIPLVQATLEILNDKDKLLQKNVIEKLVNEKESLNAQLISRASRITLLENEIRALKADRKYVLPTMSGLLLDVCAAGDNSCIKDGKDHGKVAAKKWCIKEGYLDAKKFEISKTRTDNDTWRIDGGVNDKCDKPCSYFDFIICTPT